MLMYVYDETGSPIAIKYRTSSYAQNTFDVFFFEKNLQGDIVAIYNSSGTKIGTYTYDAWGNFTVTTNSSVSLERLIVSTYNPFRYRGYYYDTDTSLYYLESRYYNAQWGRFLNGDRYVSTGQELLGYNMFAYCENNPIAYIDTEGEFPVFVVAAIGLCVLGFGIWGATRDYDLCNPAPEQIDAQIDQEQDEKISVGTRIKNTVLGMGIGLVVGGGAVATCGVFSVAVGGASATFLGYSAVKTFAIGALAYNSSVIAIMPFFGVEMEPIEYEPLPSQLP